MIYLDLIISFIQVGLFSIGGGYAAVPLIEAQAVTARGWLTMAEFTDLITIAEMTPGPIAINSATFVGMRVAGLGGAAAATLGCVLPSCVIVSLIAFVYYRCRGLSAMESVLSGLRPAVVALIASAGVTMLKQAVFPGGGEIDVAGLVLFVLAFFALRRFKINPIAVMGMCGAAYLALGVAGF